MVEGFLGFIPAKGKGARVHKAKLPPSRREFSLPRSMQPDESDCQVTFSRELRVNRVAERTSNCWTSNLVFSLVTKKSLPLQEWRLAQPATPAVCE